MSAMPTVNSPATPPLLNAISSAFLGLVSAAFATRMLLATAISMPV